MATKITFNGVSYRDPSEMPADVRRAYDQALGFLADRDGNGIPDVLEMAGQGNVICVQHSRITVNGRSYDGPDAMPPGVRELFRKVLDEAREGGTEEPPAQPAEHGFQLVLGVLTAAVLGFGLVMMLAVDGPTRFQTRVYIAIGALVLLGVADKAIEKFVIRLAPFSVGTTAPERRYAVVSLLLWLLAAVILFGAAWLLPGRA